MLLINLTKLHLLALVKYMDTLAGPMIKTVIIHLKLALYNYLRTVHSGDFHFDVFEYCLHIFTWYHQLNFLPLSYFGQIHKLALSAVKNKKRLIFWGVKLPFLFSLPSPLNCSNSFARWRANINVVSCGERDQSRNLVATRVHFYSHLR